AIFHSDTVQSMGNLPISMAKIGLDAITVSAHKFHGLKNSGALITRKGLLPESINFGGGQELGVRSGTVSVPDAAALALAMRLTTEKNMAANYSNWRQRLVN
ncbi:aminotransferase class V-fold PLP-dependent enzyme, partial [Microvirga sp. 3-52]|nr:aminotransferase class V-fold PLP-dependent enzyme [Microvirga sp. 3-52]